MLLPVQSIVFDLFHTLVNPEEHRPKDFKRPYRIAQLLKIEDGDSFATWWKQTEQSRHVSKSKKVAEYADDYVRTYLGRACTREELAQVDFICGRHYDQALLNPPPDVLRELIELRKRRRGALKLGLLSNADESEIKNWSRSPISDLFHSACFSCEIGYSKPAKEAYASILDRLGVAASSSIYVGDGGHDELRGARNAGFGLVVFMGRFVARNGSRTSEEIKALQGSADATLMDMHEFPELLDRLEGGLHTSRARQG